MKMNDRVWLFLNKRPPSKNGSYFYIVSGWLFTGMILLGALVGAAGISTGQQGLIPFTIVAFLLVIALSFLLYLTDRRQGYVSVIHEHRLQNWEERRKRIQGEQIKQEVQ